MRFVISLLFYFTLLLAVSTGIVGCHDEAPGCIDCPPIGGWPLPSDTALIPQELLDLVYFKNGSWWIYQMQDTLENIFDTVLVEDTERKIYYTPQKFPFAEEQIGVFLLHSYEVFFTERTEPAKRTQSHSILAQSLDFFSIDASSKGRELDWSYYLTFPFLIGKNGNNFELLDTNSVVIEGKNHRSIHTKGWAELWLSPHIGITKFIPFQGKAWQLINYPIKQ
jgi:hypothetical protein